MALGAVLAGSGAQLLGSPPARASERAVTAAAAASNTAAVQGITLSGLQTDASGNTSKTLAQVETEIAASKNNFGATHIRLQIQQQTFVGDGTQYDATYAQTVYSAIDYALDLGLTVIINCQTEQTGTTRTYLYPNDGNKATNAFWDYMLTSKGGNYGGNSKATNIAELANLQQDNWCNVDIPSGYLSPFASGYYTGIVFGPGPNSDAIYQGHLSFTPEVVIEVHA